MYLNNHSYFSLRYGTIPPEQLPAIAKSYGIDTLVLTDINNTSGAFQFVQSCRREGVRPVLGIEFRNGRELLYVGIARNDEGWLELCSLLTDASLSDKPLPAEALTFFSV